jgi:hypothetical protein
MSTIVNDSEMLWHNDGHLITLHINKSDVEIVDIFCPFGHSGECHTDRFGCIVTHFVGRFGLDCNVGTCAARETLQICWSLVGDSYDPEASQLWFVPLDDEVFQAWLISKSN